MADLKQFSRACEDSCRDDPSLHTAAHEDFLEIHNQVWGKVMSLDFEIIRGLASVSATKIALKGKMGEELVADIAKVILLKVLSLVAEEVSLARSFRFDLERLRSRLETIQALLSDAEAKQITMRVVRVWLKKLKAVAYDADIILDELAYEVVRYKVEVKGQMMNKVRGFFTSVSNNPVAFHQNMAHKIKDLNQRLDEIYKESTLLKINVVEHIGSSSSLPTPQFSETLPYIDASKILGRDTDVSRITEMLLAVHDTRDVSIVAIVGMAGQGKTALAQLVYKNDNLIGHFDNRIWVCVSHPFEVRRILCKMLEFLTASSFPELELQGLITKLQENLNGKRYLLVLDDVWNEIPKKWDDLRGALQGIDGSGDSKILVTTRSEEVVSAIHTHLAHQLTQLSFDNSWSIFTQIAFAKGGAIRTRNLEAIGRRLVERCNGVPLAVNALGGLMYSKRFETEWVSIRDSPIWGSVKDTTGVLDVLRLSYNHLPSPSLKQCFSYCSIFPKDIDLEKDKLIQLWMALGLLQPPEGSRLLMEDIGNQFFYTLVRNFLLHDAVTDDYGTIISCKMHDLVHDLALDTSKEYCLSLNNALDLNDVTEVPHISLISHEQGIGDFSKQSSMRLQTLMLSSPTPTIDFNVLIRFKCLRVLSLDCMIENLPSCIGNLIHLRYLDISKTWIKTLPDNITKLYYLETLRLGRIGALPKNFANLINLRHIYVDNQAKEWFTVNSIRKLTSLQTLPALILSRDKGCRIKELGGLTNLRGELNIRGLEEVIDMEEARSANLCKKSKILALGFYWRRWLVSNSLGKDKEVLEGLEPHPDLKILTIHSFGGEDFPLWMVAPSRSTIVLENLVRIELLNIHSCKHIPPLGHLALLKFVMIDGMDNVTCIGEEFYGNISTTGEEEEAIVLFPSLEQLTLRKMGHLREWLGTRMHPSTKVFPCLKELVIDQCCMLMRLPGHDFPSLKEMTIRNMDEGRALSRMSSKLTSLTSLQIVDTGGSEMKTIIEKFLGQNELTFLEISGCHGLSDLGKGLHNLGCLESLRVEDCSGLKTIGDELAALVSVQNLRILKCPSLVSITNLTYLPRLVSLEIGPFSDDLNHYPGFGSSSPFSTSVPTSEIISLSTSIKNLRLTGWKKLKSLPEQIQNLSCLIYLELSDFDGLEALPEWLGNLSSLEYLRLGSCKELMYMPSGEAMQRLTRLTKLVIKRCPILENRCSKGRGPEWFKISHIPHIQTGEVTAQVLSAFLTRTTNHLKKDYGRRGVLRLTL